jgi:hypothetical protein
VPRSERIVLVNPGAKVVEVHYGSEAHRVRPGAQVEVPVVEGRSRRHIDELLRMGLLRVVPDAPVPQPPPAPARATTRPAAKATTPAAPARPGRPPRKRSGGS